MNRESEDVTLQQSDLPVDIIFVSMEDWDDIWRRNQFVCSELARRHPGMKILFVGLPRDLSHDLRHGRLTGIRKAATANVPGFSNVVVTHALKLLPNSLWVGRKINEWLARGHIRRAARRMGIRRPILWLNPHYAVHMAGRMGERGVVYDITDDWISLSQSEALRRLVAGQDAELCRRADQVIVCSQKLFDLKREMAKNLHLIANGVDADHYRCVLEGTGPLAKGAEGWRGPVMGYTGSIHPDRVDVALVEAIARKWEGSVVLVGPNMLPEGDVAKLMACGNVFLPGPAPYMEIPNLMRAFDVCITPHRVTPFTESLNPIKLWEYLAAGKPIVSTDVAGFRDYPQYARIASGADDFIAAAMAGMNEGPEIREARRIEARKHSWASRVDQISGVLEAIGGQRAELRRKSEIRMTKSESSTNDE